MLHSFFVCLLGISEQTVIISIHSINSLASITQMEYVYCAVGIWYLYLIQIKLTFKG
jgi:hypothetical protein